MTNKNTLKSNLHLSAKTSVTNWTWYKCYIDKQKQGKLLKAYTRGQLSQKLQLGGEEAPGAAACSHCPIWEPPLVQDANGSVTEAKFLLWQKDSPWEPDMLVARSKAGTWGCESLNREQTEGWLLQPPGKTSWQQMVHSSSYF